MKATRENINGELERYIVPIDSVEPYPGNPRHGDIGAISQSLTEFGQQKPILVQKGTRHIVAGNHVWRSAQMLGWGVIAAVETEMDDLTARRYLIADNRTSELGEYDMQTLGDILTELETLDVLDGTGYDVDDVHAIMDELERQAQLDAKARGARKSTLCDICTSPGLRFQLKLIWSDTDGVDHGRGAGSIVLCESCWLMKAQPEMNHPVKTFRELTAVQGEDDDASLAFGSDLH